MEPHRAWVKHERIFMHNQRSDTMIFRENCHDRSHRFLNSGRSSLANSLRWFENMKKAGHACAYIYNKRRSNNLPVRCIGREKNIGAAQILIQNWSICTTVTLFHPYMLIYFIYVHRCPHHQISSTSAATAKPAWPPQKKSNNTLELVGEERNCRTGKHHQILWVDMIYSMPGFVSRVLDHGQSLRHSSREWWKGFVSMRSVCL